MALRDKSNHSPVQLRMLQRPSNAVGPGATRGTERTFHSRNLRAAPAPTVGTRGLTLIQIQTHPMPTVQPAQPAMTVISRHTAGGMVCTCTDQTQVCTVEHSVRKNRENLKRNALAKRWSLSLVSSNSRSSEVNHRSVDATRSPQ